MSIKFARRAASEILGRGESSIRFKPDAIQEIKKAITKDDVRKLIENKSIIAVKPKHNISMNSKVLKQKREAGKRRGPGRKKGTLKARGTTPWKKRVRAQRMLLKELKRMGKIDTKTFNSFYMRVTGNSFPNKASLLLHIKDSGISITDDELKQINERIKSQW
ncbi:MAG: 50S ribosomal protein L19e [Candidatus Micrarchaeaceae archaeon]